MNIFRKFRWKLTLSYTLVTVSAFLVVILILGAIILPQMFVPNNILTPDGLVETIKNNSTPLWSKILSQTPVDTELIEMLLQNANGTITGYDINIGNIQLSIKTFATMSALLIGADGIILGRTGPGFSTDFIVGQKLDVQQVQNLETIYNAAQAGDTDSSHLYSILEANNRFLLTFPLFNRASGDQNRVVGVIVVLLESIPTESDIPANILDIAGRSLLIFLLGAGIMGAIFGAFIANGLDTRFKKLSAATDAWSEGNFSRFIDDPTGDEIAQFSQRLNAMARQLQSLLRKRQDLAVSEERNRLARDLHDSAKQQALAASFQLGTALTLFDQDPQTAKLHLQEADGLVDSVRKELTNLVHELRPQSAEGQAFSETLREYAVEWSNRSGIALNLKIEGEEDVTPETRDTLFRIAQEALANVARHSTASHADISLEVGPGNVRMSIKDNGCGFDVHIPHGGLGLFSMRERAEASGGTLTVESAPGQGTRVEVTLPVAGK